LIVIYDCVGTYDKTIIMDWYVVGQWWWIVSTCLLNLLSFPCPPFLPRIIITTLLCQAYTYSWVMLLIVVYEGVMLVQMTWYMDESVTTIRDDIAFSIVLYRVLRWIMYGPIGNHTNDNNTSIPSSSLSVAAAAVPYPWVQHKNNT